MAENGPELVLQDWLKPIEHRTYLANAFGVFVLVSMFLALVLQRPDLLALGAPFLLALIAAFVIHRSDTFSASVEMDRTRGVAGDIVTVAIDMRSAVGIPRADVELKLPFRLRPASTMRAVVTVQPGEVRRIEFPLELTDWGVAAPEALTIQATGRFGLITRRYVYRFRGEVRISLPDERMRSLLEPDRFRSLVGSHLSEDRGVGVEIADVRPYQPGDPLKLLNWRISNRRNEPWVTLRHPDRSSTVVVVVDAIGAMHDRSGETSRHVARAAVALTRTHLGVHDRVGLALVGAKHSWVPPQLGAAQMHRIADALLDLAAPQPSPDRQFVFQLDRVIPLDAVIVVISPLTHSRILEVIGTLRSRGRSVSVLQPQMPKLSAEHGADIDMYDEAVRIFDLELAVLRRHLADQGVAVMPWRGDQSVESVLEAMRKLRRARTGTLR